MEKIHEKTLRTAHIRRSTTKMILLVVISSILVLFSVLAAQAASLYFSPSSGTYQTGRNFTVNIRAESPASMNAASGVIIFPTDKLEVLSVSKTGSIFNL